MTTGMFRNNVIPLDEVEGLLRENERLRVQLAAVIAQADALHAQIRKGLEDSAEQDAERAGIAKSIRRRLVDQRSAFET